MAPDFCFQCLTIRFIFSKFLDLIISDCIAQMVGGCIYLCRQIIYLGRYENKLFKCLYNKVYIKILHSCSTVNCQNSNMFLKYNSVKVKRICFVVFMLITSHYYLFRCIWNYKVLINKIKKVLVVYD